MRIAILQGAFFPVPPIMGGAIEKMWYSLSLEFSRRGHQVTHVSRLVDGLPKTEIVEGINHIRVRGFDTPKSIFILKGLDFIYSLRVRKIFNEHFDIVISNTFWAPVLFTTHSRQVCMVDVQRVPKGQMKLYKGVSRYRANSTPVATAIRDEIDFTQRQRVVLIPNPLPFIPNANVDFASKKPTILYVGRIHPEKGLDLLIKAYHLTSQNYQLKLVGPWDITAGGGGNGYIKQLRDLAGDASVEFVGPVYDTDKLNEFYKEASLFAYPSLAEKGETFGLAPLEAMAWGCVPVVSDLECFKDFIEDGVNGRIFDHRSRQVIDELANCLTVLQEDIKLQRTFGEKALEVRQSHSIKHIANLFLEEFGRMRVAKHNQHVS